METVHQGHDVADNLYFYILIMNPSLIFQIKVYILSFVPVEIQINNTGISHIYLLEYLYIYISELQNTIVSFHSHFKFLMQ